MRSTLGLVAVSLLLVSANKDEAPAAVEAAAPPPPHRSQRVYAGLVAGALSSVLLQPLDVVKTRMQTRRSSGGALSVAFALVQDEGLRSLWAGWVPSTVRLAGGIALYFLFLGEVETVSKQLLGALSGTAALLRDFLVGGVSRGLAAALFCPITVVKTRQEEGVAGAGGLGTQLVRLAQVEGLAGCFAGLGPSLLRDVPYSGLSLALLRAFRTPLLGLLPGTLVGALAGCASAACATVLTQPADVVRTEVVLQGRKDKRLGSLQAIGSIVSARGLSALFVGATPRLARRMLQQAFTWAVFEAVVLGNR
jgi:solute carrier family 25 protein 38